MNVSKTTTFYNHVAKKVGVNSAVLLTHIGRFISMYESVRRGYYDGRCWLKVSIAALADDFEYMTEKQVRFALDKLINGGYIMARCLNNSAYDRTLSYALTDKGAALLYGEEV